MSDKIKVGWFSFTCCEDSTIMFAEYLNLNYESWLKRIDFVHARVLRKDSSDELQPMDVAFVEGAISSSTQEEKLLEIRKKANRLVAIGTCAVQGNPSNQRNFFNSEQQQEIKPILERFKYKGKVLKLSDIVEVDDEISGCPMDEKKFLTFMDELIQ